MDWLLPAPSELKCAFRDSGYVVLQRALPGKVLSAWKTRVVELAHRFALSISRTSEGHHLQYRVVTGEVIREHWPEFYQFYIAESTRAWIQAVTGEPQIFTSVNLRSALNVNVLERPGDAYRWHFDAVAYTMILFLADLEPQDGGELEFYPGCKAWMPPASEEGSVQPVRVPCHAGTLVLMDGTRCYHRVAPILRPCCRITVPMVFPNVIEDRRPDALDSYLYDESEPSAA